MPQMAPMSWTLLFLAFIIVFFTMNILNFFIKKPKIDKKFFKFNNIYNWKW
uniref:ATP synthase complex subunit 8 n=1 Tax=Ptinus rufipes TaxID=904172 RepID=E3VTC1_9COLE|nr:ATP synthase F0 subunit 8 [Ptinus rufipes]